MLVAFVLLGKRLSELCNCAECRMPFNLRVSCTLTPFSNSDGWRRRERQQRAGASQMRISHRASRWKARSPSTSPGTGAGPGNAAEAGSRRLFFSAPICVQRRKRQVLLHMGPLSLWGRMGRADRESSWSPFRSDAILGVRMNMAEKCTNYGLRCTPTFGDQDIYTQ